jgi:importin subunit beta-1
MGPQTADYANAFMSVLLENLQSEVLNRNVKIPILACFGDIALAIGAQFQPYLEATMNVLRQAGSLSPNPMDYELIDYVNSLREGILDAYIGVVQAFKNTDKGEPSPTWARP